MTATDISITKLPAIRLVADNSGPDREEPEPTMLLTRHEQNIIHAFRLMHPEYARCFMATLMVLAEEHPARPAPKLHLISPAARKRRGRAVCG